MAEASGRQYDFGLNPRLRVSLARVGRECEPVLTVDGVMREAQALVDYAAAEVQFAPAASDGAGGYPGLRAPAPLDYVERVVRSLAPIIEQGFELEHAGLLRAECSFSLVTLPPERLAPLQRIPHVDTIDPLQLAFLHFLCDERFGGTAFYRHRATGFETLTAARWPIYQEARDRDLRAAAPGPGYIRGDAHGYEQTAVLEARFNRLLVYRSCVLHSGQIDPWAGLSSDPRTGRLTANLFVSYRAP